MSLQKQFNKFNEEIRVTWQDSKMKEIRGKNEGENGIEKQIKSKFKEEGYPIKEVFNQGSYASNTSIIPMKEDDYDIDRGIVIDAGEAPKDPREPKKVLRDVLINRNLKNPKIKIPCTTAQYYEAGDEKFHIDYPIYKKDSEDRYFLAIGREFSGEDNRYWEEVDIKGLIKWLDAKDSLDFLDEEERDQYKRLVRYMKKWRNYVFTGTERKNIYSVGLSVMIKEKLMNCISWEGDINDLEALYNTVNSILMSKYFTPDGLDSNLDAKYIIKVDLPKLPYSNIFRKHGTGVGTIFYNKLITLKDNLEVVMKEESLEKQCELLRDKIFGKEFPIAEDKKENKKFDESGYMASSQGA